MVIEDCFEISEDKIENIVNGTIIVNIPTAKAEETKKEQ